MKTHLLLLCSAVVFAVGCGAKPTQLPPPTIAITAIGKPLGVVAQTPIESAGGTVVSADGRLTIEVPAGALSASQMITIQPITNEAPNGKGLAYRLGPEGQSFAKPVKLVFNYGKSDTAGSEPLALKIAYQDAQARWNALKAITLDEAKGTLSVETTHFSDWSLLAGWQLKPSTATLGGGNPLNLEVVVCSTEGTGSDELANLAYLCRPDPDFLSVKSWSANGVVNGDSTVGTVKSTGDNVATYTAPLSPPSANPVAVTAEALDNKGRKTVLVASVWVDARPPMKGTITTTQVSVLNFRDVITTNATVSFAYDVAQEAYVPTVGVVNAAWDIRSDEANCSTNTTATATIGGVDGSIGIDGTGSYVPAGVTQVEFKGTSNCTSSKTTEPFSTPGAVVWFPTPMTEMTMKPDGRLEESLTDVPSSQRKVAVQWSLVPQQN